MKHLSMLVAVAACSLPLTSLAGPTPERACTVPVTLDHNRMLVDAEVQGKDGAWHKARLWVDTGNPELMLDEAFADKLGIDLGARDTTADGRRGNVEIPPPAAVRLGGMAVDFVGVKSSVLIGRPYLGTMHADGNLPATVMKRYQVVFDYPGRRLTLAVPGTLTPRGTRVPATVNASTGIVQIDATIAGEALSFALDNGASYSFVSSEVLDRLGRSHPAWPRSAGAVGCANIWGLWPQEESWPILRVPEIAWGGVRLAEVGLVGLPPFFSGGSDVGAWYSRKTARPVAGFLGPNAFKAFRVEIDYAAGAVYFEKGAEPDVPEFDLVGLTIRPQPGGRWEVLGVVQREGKPVVEGIEAGDALIEVGGVKLTGVTMGTVVDALRGKPGETRTLVIERNGTRLTVEAKVRRLL